MTTFTKSVVYVTALLSGLWLDWLAIGVFVRHAFPCPPRPLTCDVGAIVSIPLMLVTLPIAGLFALWLASRVIARRRQQPAANDVV